MAPDFFLSPRWNWKKQNFWNFDSLKCFLGLRIEEISSKFVNRSKSGKHMQIIKVIKLQQSKIASCKMDPSKMYLFIERASFSELPTAMLVYKKYRVSFSHRLAGNTVDGMLMQKNPAPPGMSKTL